MSLFCLFGSSSVKTSEDCDKDYNTENEKLIKKREECKSKANPANKTTETTQPNNETKQQVNTAESSQPATQGQQPVPAGTPPSTGKKSGYLGLGFMGLGGRKSRSKSRSAPKKIRGGRGKKYKTQKKSRKNHRITKK